MDYISESLKIAILIVLIALLYYVYELKREASLIYRSMPSEPFNCRIVE